MSTYTPIVLIIVRINGVQYTLTDDGMYLGYVLSHLRNSGAVIEELRYSFSKQWVD